MPHLPIIQFLDIEIRSIILKDIKSIALNFSRLPKKRRAGWFTVIREVFCIIDYLGFISFEEAGSSANSINFIKTYFPDEYKNYAELLYSMHRLGTVHLLSPITYVTEFRSDQDDNITLAYCINNSNTKRNRSINMRFLGDLAQANYIYLNLNTCQLVDDLIFSLDNLISVLKQDEKLRVEIAQRVTSLSGPQKCSEKLFNKRANLVQQQIRLGSESLYGYLNADGNVIKNKEL